MPGPLVAGFDIATSVGCADGRPNEKPRTWTWNLKEAGISRPAKLVRLFEYCERYFRENQVDIFCYEKGMNIRIMMQIGASDDTIALLRGAIGVVEVCAYRAHIPIIQAVSVNDARSHLVGGAIPKGKGKQFVMDRCKMLGWKPDNFDESDACAIWSYGCGKANPMSALAVTPLFGRARQ